MEINKEEIVAKYATHPGDTGSPEVQVALLTARIVHLTEHFKINNRDFAGKRGMLSLVSRRRTLLDYLNRHSPSRYTTLIQSLNLRK